MHLTVTDKEQKRNHIPFGEKHPTHTNLLAAVFVVVVVVVIVVVSYKSEPIRQKME